MALPLEMEERPGKSGSFPWEPAGQIMDSPLCVHIAYCYGGPSSSPSLLLNCSPAMRILRGSRIQRNTEMGSDTAVNGGSQTAA